MMPENETNDWARAQVTVSIECPLEVAFAFICDPRNDSRWLGNVGDAERLTPGPIGAGSRFRQAATFLGAPVEGEWEITDYVPDRHMRGRSVAGPFVFVREYECLAEGSATRITQLLAVRLTGALAFLPNASANGLLSNASERALARLKTILETRAAAGGKPVNP
jgi:hypothetical protein